MKILYGVQGTGNGHLTRARAMHRALQKVGVDVDWIFSGRARENYFDMGNFGNFRSYRGLSFAADGGRVNLFKSMQQAGLGQLWQDAQKIDVDRYDLIVTDFEPIVAWAARRAGRRCLGIGHQYAFQYDIPKAGSNVATDMLLKWFAPATESIGLHWHHFNQPILPPIIEQVHAVESKTEATLVYLPFENSRQVLSLLATIDHSFVFHCADLTPGRYGNVIVRGFSRTGFQYSLANVSGVICNAGFELVSEALTLGHRVLVKPLKGQMEQASNAKALTELGYGLETSTLCRELIRQFLASASVEVIQYPDVAQLITDWMLQSQQRSIASLARTAWQRSTNLQQDMPAA